MTRDEKRVGAILWSYLCVTAPDDLSIDDAFIEIYCTIEAWKESGMKFDNFLFAKQGDPKEIPAVMRHFRNLIR